MMYHNVRPVVFVAGRTVATAFDVRDAGDGWRAFRCRGCALHVEVAPGREPDAHVCPEEGQAQRDPSLACRCFMVVLVTGRRRFYLDGDRPDCPVHGGGDPYADLGDLRSERARRR